MSDFTTCNLEYSQYFTIEPPSRACVDVPLPDSHAIRLHVIGLRQDGQDSSRNKRSGLHVQGLSYWAPANIGPYGQGVTVRFVVCPISRQEDTDRPY